MRWQYSIVDGVLECKDSKLKVEPGYVYRYPTMKDPYAILMSLVFGTVVFLKVGNGNQCNVLENTV